MDSSITLVVQIDIASGNVVGKYFNEHRAASAVMCYARDIVKCLNGFASVAGGFRWRREGTFIEQVDSTKLDENGDPLVLNSYDSAEMAVEALYTQLGDKGIIEEGPKMIIECCKGDESENMYMGFRWRLHGFNYLKFNGNAINTAVTVKISSPPPSPSVTASIIKGREKHSRQASRSREVYRIEPFTGSRVHYEGATMAAKLNRFSHYPENEIINCCNGETAMAGGYEWKWANDVDNASLRVPAQSRASASAS